MKLAITGMIGAGKSTALQELKNLGWLTISTDELARETAKTKEAEEFLKGYFDTSMLKSVGFRAELRKKFLTDEVFRKAWEGFVHLRVNNAWKGLVNKTPSANWAVEIPLLYEKGLEREFDKVVVCVCSPNVALSRWIAKRDLGERSAKDYQELSKLLMPPQEKIPRADFVLQNDGAPREFFKQVCMLHEELLGY